MSILPSPSGLNAELAKLLADYGAEFVITAYLRRGPLTLDVSDALQQAGIVFEIGIVNSADRQRTVQPGTE
jgi:hypothetical protein